MEEYIKSLNQIVRGENFREIISFFYSNDYVSGNTDTYETISERELLFITAIWIKNINEPNIITESNCLKIISEIRQLLYKIHYTYYPKVPFNPSDPFSKEFWESTIHDEILYGGSGYNFLQVLPFISQKYENDREWILKKKKIDIDLFMPFCLDINNLFSENDKSGSVDLFTLDIDRILQINGEYGNIIDAFSFDINSTIDLEISL